MTGCVPTASGLQFDLFNPKPENVRIEDIAQHLSRIPRFNGATKEPFSFAQHCVLVARYCDREDAGYGLMHCAAVAYLNDLSESLKAEIPLNREVERQVQAAIYQAVGLRTDQPLPKSVIEADRVARELEARDFLPSKSWRQEQPIDPKYPRLVAYPADEARTRFMSRFFELTLTGALIAPTVPDPVHSKPETEPYRLLPRKKPGVAA